MRTDARGCTSIRLREPDTEGSVEPIPDSTSELDAQSLALLGESFLAYICAASEEAIAERVAGRKELAPRQEAVLSDIIGLSHQLMNSRNLMQVGNVQVPEAPADVLSRLCIRFQGQENAFSTGLRGRAGGSVVDFSSEDDLLRPVLEMAQDYYPALLLPREHSPFDRSPFPIPLGLATLAAPGNAAVAAAIAEDEALRELFPKGDIELDSYSRQFMARSGRGSSAHASFLATTFLINAEPQAWRAGKLSRQSYLRAVRDEVEGARRLAVGQETTVRVSVGLAPADLPDDWRLTTPWGILRAPNSWERRWAPEQAGAVLDVEFPMAVLFGDPEGSDFEEFMRPNVELEANVDQLRLALVLATPGNHPFALSQVWQLIPDPLQLPGFRFGFAQPKPGAGDTADQSELKRWCRLVLDRHRPDLDLAARRLLSSLATRTQPEDGLLDAMVALESLFGTGQSEIGFRLSVAVAWLLDNDRKSRAKRQKQVAALYSKRSRIVHGARLKRQEVEEAQVEATQLVIDAMRALYSERPELIADDQRGKTLALAGPT
jgi:hypothetical protein